MAEKSNQDHHTPWLLSSLHNVSLSSTHPDGKDRGQAMWAVLAKGAGIFWTARIYLHGFS